MEVMDPLVGVVGRHDLYVLVLQRGLPPEYQTRQSRTHQKWWAKSNENNA
jgi:hypothetical protein